jgi:2-aminoethylphosphonate transport system ATP-binding protein
LKDGIFQPPRQAEPRDADASSAPGIAFRGVTVAYGKNTVLDSFDLAVPRGQVMALLGPSGSGKTTALRAVAGFVTPVSGRVFIGGRDVTALPPYRRGVGMVVQQYSLFPHMRVEQNVAYGLKAHRVKRSEIPERVSRVLHMTGMSEFATRYPRELSGGQQQRVAIARALAIQPEVLLLDEPLSALDAQLRSGMLAELARIHRELPGVSILYVTHDQVEALTLANRIAVMRQSRLVECGTPQELYHHPRTEFTASFLGDANLLPVEVAGHVETGLITVTHGDATFTLPATGPLPEEGSALLCVRPHALRLSPFPDANALRAVVADVQWRGSTHRLHLDLDDGQRVKADIAELRDPPAVGRRVTVYFAPEDTGLLPIGSQLPARPATAAGHIGSLA